MIEGGKGGANTNKTGLGFEKRVDLRKKFEGLKDYSVEGNDLLFEGKIIAKFFKKHGLYRWLSIEHKIDADKILSKKLLPDETIFILKDKKLFIIEMKFQKVSGSVDEKLQTCDFKRKQYTKLLKPANIGVEYVYILGNWFKQQIYKDTLDYILSVNCFYFFEELPFSFLALPNPKATEMGR